MAFDEQLAEKIRNEIKGQAGLKEKKMFGGLAFLINGNISVGIHGKDLVVRINPDETEAALKQRGVHIFDITGRPMKGWLLVGAEGIQDRKSFKKWIRTGVHYASSLPKK
jgi:hypothetical protein